MHEDNVFKQHEEMEIELVGNSAFEIIEKISGFFTRISFIVPDKETKRMFEIISKRIEELTLDLGENNVKILFIKEFHNLLFKLLNTSDSFLRNPNYLINSIKKGE